MMSVLPTVAALLLQKCPVCMAAWIAAGTGLTVPGMFAESVRPLLGFASLLSMCFVCYRWLARISDDRLSAESPCGEIHESRR